VLASFSQSSPGHFRFCSAAWSMVATKDCYGSRVALENAQGSGGFARNELCLWLVKLEISKSLSLMICAWCFQA
jgi:hypothetical protein